ncbi:MAG: hypothetical protein HY235_03800 [Acidobacteria bacterium]|nr:hypothetical protein [Acidobacteriota bacterium]
MSKRTWTLTIAGAIALIAGLSLYSQRGNRPAAAEDPSGNLSFRILLGVNDRASNGWDGSISVTPGRITRIRGWRFTAADSAGANSWKAATRQSPGKKGKAGPILENGVIVTASAEQSARFQARTAQGDFSFQASEIPYGQPKPFLEGRALVDRVPVVSRLTQSDEEQDFPAIAHSGDNAWLGYVEFTHGDREVEARRQFDQEPKSFDFLARPAGGDQVFLMRYSKSQMRWSAPMAVSAPRQDVMRTAVAVDGQNRVWVFWSAGKNGNFDIYAKSYDGSRWGQELRLTEDAGTDVNPVAATDAQGRVWVAWQAFRNGSLDILAAAQNGEGFTAETVVSNSKASDWDASIAAAQNGEVAVSWDTYDKGDYDVYFRRMRWRDGGIRMDAPVPVAAGQNFEARSSIAYDARNRLWAAYEASDVRWGKDFGAYETTGVALYQNHNLRVKCFDGGKAFEASADVQEALPGGEAAPIRRRAARAQGSLPNPELFKLRPPSGTPQPPALPMNSFPRLAADPGGLLYLSFRAPVPGRSPLGTVWMQHLVYLDGAEWKGPVQIPNTDDLLDGRAALAAIAPGQLLLVASSDHRQTSAQRRRAAAAAAANDDDGMQSDLYAASFQFDAGTRAPQLKPAAAEPVAKPDTESAAERAQIALIRGYRAQAGSARLQLMRGEFHRHTEVSGDGGRDGPLIDAYRYLIDGASMDWGGCCDHDNGNGREYSWWIEQKLTDAYKLGTSYVPMFSYERSVRYPEGHRNVVMARRGVRPLPRLPKVADEAPPAPAPDTQMLYKYLRQFDGIVAMHTSGTNMGTDWRDNDPILEPAVEIYQGDRQNYEMPGGPRSNNENDSIGGWRPLGFVSLALQKGYRLAFQASSDHISTHMSYCNLWVTAPTREAIMEAFHKRRVYGATDNILADFRSGEHFMGEEFSVSQPPSFSVKLWGTDNFAKVYIIRDGEYVYTAQPRSRKVDFTWRDANAPKGKTSYYYVRGEQADGEIVWVSPMWITVQ